MRVEECCQAVLAYLLPLVDAEKEGICLDIGVGTFAFYCELFARLGFQTTAVEPLPVDVLRQVCQHYDISLIESCIAEVSGIQTLHIGTFQGVENLNLCSLAEDWWGSSTKTLQVPSQTLSQLLSSINPQKITCLKLDVEGAESAIIRQFLDLPEALMPSVVMFEYGGGDNMQSGKQGWAPKFMNGTRECLSNLKQCGYSFSMAIDAASHTTERFFNLQSYILESDFIFPDEAVYGNIITSRYNLAPAMLELAQICANYCNFSSEEITENCSNNEATILRERIYFPSASSGVATVDNESVIAMSTLGINGRFANQLFQYAFLKIYAKKHDFLVETSEWIGQYLFGHKDQSVTQQLPIVVETTNNLSEARIPKVQTALKNVELWGYFQYHSAYYLPYKNYFLSIFHPVSEIERKMQVALESLRCMGKTIVGLHLRRGDYPNNEIFFIAPSEWYKEWLRDLWQTLDEPVLFIASDEIEKVKGDFSEYNPITAKDLHAELSQAEFYPDFYLLSQCDVVAISNSSFSFAACMLNERGKLFVRPNLQLQKLISFDPWNSEILLLSDPQSEKIEPVGNSWISKEREVDIEESLQIGSLREINLVIFPDWSLPKKFLELELKNVMKILLPHPDRSLMTLLVDASNISLEEADLVLSGAVMNLLLQENLDVTEAPEIVLIDKMSEKQWESLLPRIIYRILLVNDNRQAIDCTIAKKIPICELDSFSRKRAIQLETGVWELQ